MDSQYKRTKYDSIQHCPTCGRNFNVGYGLKSKYEMLDLGSYKTRLYFKTCRHCGCEFKFYWDKTLKKNVFFIEKEGKMPEKHWDRFINEYDTPNILYILEGMLKDLSQIPVKTISLGAEVYKQLEDKIERVQPLGIVNGYFQIGEYRISEENLLLDNRLHPRLIRIWFNDTLPKYEPYAAATPKLPKKRIPMGIKKVIFNNPATIVIWVDGTKTVVKRQKGDRYDKEKGLAMAIIKRSIGLKAFYEAMEEAEE